MARSKTDDGLKLDIPEQARLDYRHGMDVEREIREEFNKRMKYRAGDQWDPKHIEARGKDRPAVVVNLLEQPIQQVVNSNLLNRPGGKVSAADDAGSVEVAKFLQGRVRHIEYESNANVAYGTCISYVAAGGFGLIALHVDYVALDSLDQEVRIRTIQDPAAWVLDPSAKEPDRSDMAWAIGRQKFSREAFERRWPGKTVVDASFYEQDSSYADWGDGEDVWVAEYWRVEFRKRILQAFSNGKTGFLDDKRFMKSVAGARRLRGSSNSREVDFPSVYQYLVSGVDVLDKTPWLGTRIPIFPVYANEFYADGKRVVKSLISDSLTSQQTYNCSESLKLEAVALAPKPKWLVTRHQVAGHEAQWKNANLSNDAALFWNPEPDETGATAPPPEWKVFQPPVEAFSAVSAQAKDDVKATSGFPNVALGEFDSQRQSGRAVEALQQVSGQGTIHYASTLADTLKALYIEVIDIDRKLNTAKKSLRIIRPDGKHDLMKVNDPSAKKPLMLSDGRYGVIVSAGPSVHDQREAAAEFISDTQEHDPQGWALVRDIGARLKESELGHWADEIADRWTPPQFRQQDPNAPPLPPEVQQMLAQHSVLVQKVQQLEQIIQGKQVEEQGKYQRELEKLKIQLEIAKVQADATIRAAELRATTDTFATQVDAQARKLEAQIDFAKDTTLQAHKHAHEGGLEAMKHSHAKDLAQQQADLNPQPPPEDEATADLDDQQSEAA